jgi:hypothetical protein
MKHIKNNTLFLFVLITSVFFTSCFETEKVYQEDLVTYPAITVADLSPTEALSGELVTINGTNFGEFQQAGKVYFNGVIAEDVISYSDTQIVVAVPAKANSGKIQVDVWGSIQETTNEFSLIPGAEIAYYSPSIADAGQNISIVGDNFGTDPNAISVSFFDNVTVDIISITNTEIIVKVPFAGGNGPITITKGVQVLVGPDFSYPVGRLKFLFDADNNFETIVGFNNPSDTSMSVSGGSLSGNYDVNSAGYLGFQTPTNKELTVSSEYPLLAIKLDHLPATRFAMYFAGGWYANAKTPGFAYEANAAINAEGVYYFDLSTNGPGFGSGAVQPFAGGATTFTDVKRLIFLLGDAGNTSIDVDWIISFKDEADIKSFLGI